MIDPIDAAVVRAGLVSAAREAFAQFQRTAMLPILYEARDFSVSIFDDRLNMVADATGVPEFVGSLSVAIDAILEKFGGAAGLRRGDVLIANESHLTGAHPPDAVLLAPAFAGDLLVGFCGMRAHIGDLGGSSTTPIDAKTMWEEGLLIPPSLLIAAGKPNEVLLGVIGANSRQPREVTGNLRSGAAAMTRSAAKVGVIVERYGFPTYRAAVDQLLDAAEHEARELLEEVPDGEYRATKQLELPNGAGSVPLECLVAVEGSAVTVDVTGSAPEQPYSVNVPLPQTLAACRLAIKRLTTQDTITANSGEHRMLSVVAPRGCVFNATAPAGCYMMANTASLLGEMIVNLISAAMPARQMAESGGNTTGFLGWMPDGGRNGGGVDVDDLAGIGYGATPERDGMNALLYFGLAGMEVASGEVIETRARIVKRRIELVPDSGGAGRRRGGLGSLAEWEIERPMTMMAQAQKTEDIGGLGLAGGMAAGGRNDVVLDPGTPGERSLAMTSDTEVAAGTRIVINGAGGGGYGDPFEREIEAVAADVADGYVSTECAAELYGVVVSADTGVVDLEATAALRRSRTDRNGGDGDELHSSQGQPSMERID